MTKEEVLMISKITEACSAPYTPGICNVLKELSSDWLLKEAELHSCREKISNLEANFKAPIPTPDPEESVDRRRGDAYQLLVDELVFNTISIEDFVSRGKELLELWDGYEF